MWLRLKWFEQDQRVVEEKDGEGGESVGSTLPEHPLCYDVGFSWTPAFFDIQPRPRANAPAPNEPTDLRFQLRIAVFAQSVPLQS